MHRGSRALVFSLLTVVILASGCRRGEQRFVPNRFPNRPVQVLVQNNQFLDVTIHAVGDGASLRLGDVTGKSTATLEISPRRFSMAGGVQLRVEPIGSTGRFLSHRVYVTGGDQISLVVAADLRQSSVSVR